MKKKWFLFLLFIFIMSSPITAGAVMRDDVLNVAKAEIGVSGVPNKYTIWLGKIGGNNSYAWCHAFVSWCANQAGAGNIIPRTASCASGAQWFRDRGQWKARSSGYTPQAGDIIYFDWGPNGGYDHVGIVTYTSAGRVHTIEGNARNTVKYDGGYANGYSLTDPQILGYGVPAYESRQNSAPVGAVDYLTPGINTLSLGGWAYDPDDTSQAVDIRVKIGWSVYTIKADKYRTGVAPTNYHGYDDTTISVNEVGTQNVSVYAVDLNDGQEKLIGSGTVTIDSKKSPNGAVDAIGGGEDYIGLSGWACDPDDTSKPVTVRIDLIGASSYTLIANSYREDFEVNKYCGFSTRVPVKETGTYDYEIYALDLGNHSCPDTLIGSGKITIGMKHFNSYIDTNTEYIAQKIGKISGMDGELFIQGWAVDTSGIDRVDYEILKADAQPGHDLGIKGTCTYRDRVDVQQAMPDYAKGKEGFMANIPYSQLRWGGDYPDEMKIVLTAYCKGGQAHRIGEIKVGRSFAEKTAPVVSNIQITDVSYSGYTITANVTDASGISRVQFPTWTLKNGQDDILQDWQINPSSSGIISGNTVTYRVNVADHNGEAGTYVTHIYAYDKCGNYGVSENPALGKIEVPAYVKSTGITLDFESLLLQAKESKLLNATIVPENATNKTLTWKSSDTSVATVSQSGEVIAVGGGKTVISVITADGRTASCTVQVNVNVEKVTLNKTELTISGKGLTEKLIAEISPADAADKSLTWTTSNEQVAIVNDSGVVTSVGGGHAIITAASEDGMHTAECSVTVTIPVSSISLDKESIKLTKNQTTDQLTAAILPADATNTKVIWSSEDDTIAVVEDGIVTGLANGVTVVTAVTEDGLKVASCIVNVNLNDSQQFVLAYRGNGGEQVPEDETYTNGQNAVISQVIPVRSGYRFAGWGISPDAKKAVYQPGDSLVMNNSVTLYALWQEEINGIVLSTQEANLHYIGQTVRLVAFTQPGGKVCENVEWSSSEPSVANVGINGIVTAAANGETTVTAKTLDGKFYASCKISVAVPVESVSLDCATLIFDVKDSVTYLTATVLPENAANKSVTWESSNPAVVSVDENGVVTVVGNGTAVIKVSTVDGAKTDVCNVVVNYEEECIHEWGEYVVVEEATCSEPGIEAVYCMLCGEMNENTKRNIPPLGHTYEVRYSTPAACEENGIIEKYCTACGNVETEELTATGHTPGEWENVKEPTADEEGERVQKCTVCDKVIASEKIAKLDSDPETEETPETPQTSETEKTPETQQTPETEKTPETQQTPETEKTPETQQTPETSENPSASDVPRSPVTGTQMKDQKSGGIYKVSVAGVSGKAAVEYKAPINKKTAVVNIPNTVKIGKVTYKVTSIAANAFKNSKTLKKVKMGKNVTAIGANAFSGCTKLNSVTLGANVTTIGAKAFYKCTALKKITIPVKVKKIGARAFYGCTKLKNIVFKTTKLTAKNVGADAFAKIYSKAVIKTPAKAFKSYKTMLRKKGVSSKSIIKK